MVVALLFGGESHKWERKLFMGHLSVLIGSRRSQLVFRVVNDGESGSSGHA